MLRITNHFLGYLVVVTGFMCLASGLTTLSVLDFFGLEGAPSSEVAAFLNKNGLVLQVSLMMALVGYLIAVPMMLIITLWSACGAGGTTVGVPSGTPPGNYTITITGSAGATIKTSTATLTVN